LSAVIAAPVLWSAFSTHAYFCESATIGRFHSFTRIKGDGYFVYAPRHGIPEHRQFKIRRALDGWEVLGSRRFDDWSPLEGEDGVVGYLRLLHRGGALYSSWDAGKNWTRHPRLYNIWRVWAAKCAERWRLDDLRLEDFRVVSGD
jgi:hypothetical protein